LASSCAIRQRSELDNPIKIDLAELAALSMAARSAIAEPMVSQLRVYYPAVTLL
jgi:hypothetical protein